MGREQQETIEKSRMSLGAHLDELRIRLIRSAIALAVVFAGCWAFHQQLTEIINRPFDQAVVELKKDWVKVLEKRAAEHPDQPRSEYFLSDDPADQRPRRPLRDQLRTDGATTGFFLYLRICFYFTLFIGGPFVIWQVWQFIAAGLYRSERRAVFRTFPFAVLLFVGGVLFGFFYMVPFAYYTLPAMSLEQYGFDPEAERYMTFLTGLSLALGVVFLLPILMIALSRAGLVDPKQYNKYRGHFLVVSLIVAAIITPPDPMTQVMMAIPMAVLYEVGHFLSRFAYRKSRIGLPPEADGA